MMRFCTKPLREFHDVHLAVAANRQAQHFGQRVHAAHAHAVQAARHLVAVLVELAAGVQFGQRDFGRRALGLVLVVHLHAGGNAAAVVDHADRVVGVDGDQNVVAMAGQRLVDGVVHHLEHQVVQAGAVRRVADVHAGALAHGFQAFQDLDRAFAVGFGRAGLVGVDRGLEVGAVGCRLRPCAVGHVHVGRRSYRLCFLRSWQQFSNNFFNLLNDQTREASRVCLSLQALLRFECASNPHRHHHVFERGVVGNGEQRRAVAVGQLELHHVLAHVGQRVDQVGDVEADLDRVAAVVDVELVHRFFLLGVVGRHAQGAGLDVQAHALELVAGQDGGALQAGQQRHAAQRDDVLVVLRNHAVVVGELAFDQLGDELHAFKAELGLVVGKLHLDRAFFVAEQALHFDARSCAAG